MGRNTYPYLALFCKSSFKGIEVIIETTEL